MTAFRKIVLLLIVLFFKQHLFAGYPYYKNYNINDGLPSNKIYNILEDRYGFIWISTDKGVSRFDGVSFVNFSTHQGLPDNDVIGLYEDNTGRIWFQGYSSEPCYYYAGKIFNAKNDTFLNRIKRYKPIGVCMFVLVKHNQSLGFLIVQNGKKIIAGKDIEDVPFNIDIPLGENPFQQYLYKSGNKYDKLTAVDWYQWQGNGKVSKIYRDEWDGLLRNYTLNMFYSAVPKESLYGFSSLKQLLWEINPVTGKVKSRTLDGKYKELYSSDRYHVLTSDSSFTVYNHNFSKITEKRRLPFAFKRVMIDSRGNKWIGSFDNGIYLIRSNAPVKVELPPGLDKGLLSIKIIRGKILIETETNGLLVIDSAKNVKQLFNQNGYKTTMGFLDMGNCYIMGNEANGVLRLDENFNVKKQLIKWAVKDIEKGSENEILMGAREHAYIIRQYPADTVIKIPLKRISAICRLNKDIIWLGGVKGLYSYHESGIITELKKHPDLDNSRIVDIKNDGLGNMWVATDQKGLFYCPVDGKVVRFAEGSGKRRLLSDFCLQLQIRHPGEIWLATTKGVSKIQKSNTDFLVMNYSQPQGMPGISVNSIAITDSNILVATQDGLYKFRYLEPFGHETGKTLITGITVNDSMYKVTDLILPFKKNNLIISYAASFINSGNEYRFRYRVKGLGSGWINTSSLQVPLLGLEPGEYTFEIVAVNAEGVEGPLSSLHFEIMNPWFKQWWFNLLVVLIVVAIFWYYYILMREKVDLNKNLSLLRLRILRAQMNPHFVFNALSNIQRLIQIKNLKNAEQYIGTLAAIMRKSLDYSTKEFVPLAKEVDYTTNYLEIEKMRFDDKFDFVIKSELSDDEMSGIFVPPMILQPMVENAVKHAFKGIARPGMIQLTVFKKNARLLTYVIEDNGSGFAGGAVVHGHGLKITRERLYLLYKDKPANASINIHSVSMQGTIITIEIPILND